MTTEAPAPRRVLQPIVTIDRWGVYGQPRQSETWVRLALHESEVEAHHDHQRLAAQRHTYYQDWQVIRLVDHGRKLPLGFSDRGMQQVLRDGYFDDLLPSWSVAPLPRLRR